MSVFDFNNCNLYLTPAPWRQYTNVNKESVLNDWKTGKDFKVVDGPYCSIRDLHYMRENFNKIFIVYSRGSIEV